MSLWVVDAGLQAQVYTAQALLERLRPSVAVLGRPSRPTGAATLLDAERGLFVAHADAVQGDTIQARLGGGRYSLKVLARDARTNLVLLVGEGLPRLLGPAINVADAAPAPNAPILVLLAEGGLVGSFVGGQKTLLQANGKRAVPASELRFESPPQLVAGALVLSFDGHLVGTMGATLARPGNVAPATPDAIADVRTLVQSQARGKGGFQGLRSSQALGGPQSLTVAYTPNITALQRAIEGFLSKDHQPEFAGLGLQVAESPLGVVVMRLFPDSPAVKSGIKVNDVLLTMDGRPIQKQYDFLQAILAARPGEKMTVRVRHDGTERTHEVTLARTKG